MVHTVQRGRFLIGAVMALVALLAMVGGDAREVEADNRCVGLYACKDLPSDATIGSGSCIGDYSCQDLQAGVKIGQGACNGYGACWYVSGEIKDWACTGVNACAGVSPASFGAHSCAGEKACLGAQGTIGDWSCAGPNACQDAGNGEGITTLIGSYACKGSYACQNAGKDGSSTIGNNACAGLAACYGAGKVNGKSTIGADACRGDDACLFVGAGQTSGAMGASVIGAGSCVGASACLLGTPLANGGTQFSPTGAINLTIGAGSCVGSSACYSAAYPSGTFSAGDTSCNGAQACYASGSAGTSTVGAGSCQGDTACYQAGKSGSSTIGDSSCDGGPACYQAGMSGTSVIGSSSCGGSGSCSGNGTNYDVKVSIGKGSCNGVSACGSNMWTVLDCAKNQSGYRPDLCTSTSGGITIRTGGTGYTTSELGPLHVMGIFQVVALVLMGVPGFLLYRLIQRRGRSMAWLALALLPVLGLVLGFFLIRKAGTVYEDGSVIFRQGDASDRFYVIREGEVVLTHEANGVTTEYERAGPGGVIGELGVVMRAPRAATATAVGRVRLSAMSPADLLEPSGDGGEHPAGMVARALARRLQQMDAVVDAATKGQ